MTRKRARELAIGLLGLFGPSRTREDARISVDVAQRIRIECAHTLKPLDRVVALFGKVQHQPGMQIFEDRVPFRPGQFVDMRDAGPAGKKRCGEIGDWPLHGLREMRARLRELVDLDRARGERQTRNAVGLVEGDHALGKLHGLLDLAAGQRHEERPLNQIGIGRVGAERRAIEGRGRRHIARGTRDAGRQIAAGM